MVGPWVGLQLQLLVARQVVEGDVAIVDAVVVGAEGAGGRFSRKISACILDFQLEIPYTKKKFKKK